MTLSQHSRPGSMALVALAVAGAAAVLGVAGHGAHAETPRASAPCSPVAVRSLDPLVIAEEGMLEVTTSFSFSCPQDQVKMNVLFLQNGVPNGSGSGSEVAINDNLRNSILGFLDLVDRDKGTRAALAAFTDSYREVISLGAPEGWPPEWSVWSSSGLGTSGLLSALEHVDSMLPGHPADGARNVVVAVITSSDPIGDTDRIERACSALRAADGRLALIDMQQMRGSGGLGELTCIDWYFRSLDGEGNDLPSVFMSVAEAVLFTPQVQSVEIVDAMTDAFAYVPRSASPRGPTTDVGNDVTWMFDPVATAPVTLTYRVRAALGWSAVRMPVSNESRATFTYSDRSQHIVHLANPGVCIHPYNDPSYCEGGGQSIVFLPSLQRF